MLNVEFDISEMAIATFAKAREQGVPVVGLPIFTSGRRFLQAGFQVAARSGIKDLAALRGRTVCAPQYWMSSSIWQRQILQQMYGVAAEDMTWVTLQPERMSALRIPSDVEYRLDTSGRSARELAELGEIESSRSCTSPSSERSWSNAILRS
jgi:4,5-dihydroxyphthalate decarboxylase